MSRMVSTSEAADFMTCERLHYFKYRRKLRSITKSAIDWGSLFHSGLQPYYEAMRDGGTQEQCFKAADSAFAAAITEDPDLEQYAVEAFLRMKDYSEHYWNTDKKWEILEVEKTFKLPEYNYAFTIDLIVRELDGQHAGELLLIDFKTGGKFWTDRQFETNAQLPRYVWALQRIEEFKSLRRYMISQIRTYKFKHPPLPRDIFRRNKVTPPKAKLNNQRKYQEEASRRIYKFDKLTEREHRETAQPTNSYSACTYCKFSTLCDMLTTDQDISIAEQIGFEVSTYGDKYLVP